MIHSAPEVVVLALDSQHDLVEMPFFPAPRLTPAQLIGVPLPKPLRQLANCFVGDEHAATGQKFLDIAKAQRKAEVEPHYVANDLGVVAKATVKLGVCDLNSVQNLVDHSSLTVPIAPVWPTIMKTGFCRRASPVFRIKCRPCPPLSCRLILCSKIAPLRIWIQFQASRLRPLPSSHCPTLNFSPAAASSHRV